MLANVVGFGYGSGQVQALWQHIQEEWVCLLFSIYVIASTVVVMFYLRSVEVKQKNY